MRLIWITSAWFAGIFVGFSWGASPWWLWGCAAAAVFSSAWLVRQQRPFAFGLVCLAVALLGGARYQLTLQPLDANQIAFYNDRGPVTLEGLVVAEPDIRDSGLQLRLQVEQLTGRDGVPHAVTGDVLVQLPRYPTIPYGSRLVVNGRLETPPSNPDFSYRDYLARQGITSLMGNPRLLAREDGQGSWLKHQIFAFKAGAQATIEAIIPPPESGLLSGILLGVEHAMPPAIDADFRATGITHIVVISGFNISILAAIFLSLGTPLLGQRRAPLFAIAAIILYTLMVGAEASVVRAAIMGSLYIIGQRWLGRPTFALGSLFLAGLLMTIVNPLALWDVGFQLSFAATLSLMLYADPLTQAVRRWLLRRVSREATRRILGVLNEAVLVTLAAQVLTLPLTMVYFQQFSLISLTANAFILPAQPGVMIWGGLATLVGLVSPTVGELFGYVAYLFLHYTILLSRFFAEAPYALLPIHYPPLACALTYAVIGGLSGYRYLSAAQRERLRGWLREQPWPKLGLGICGLLLVVSFQWATQQPDGLLTVRFLDVGQGDAMWIETPSGRQLLVDGGYFPTVLAGHVGGQLPFWDRQLDLVIATHPDADHVTGLPTIFERYGVDQLWVSEPEPVTPTYEELLRLAQEQGTAVVQPHVGEVLDFGDGVRLEVLHPALDFEAEDRNNRSLSVRLVYGSFRLLLTGDGEIEAEEALLAGHLHLDATVLKAGHHGAANGSSLPFLEAVQPHIVIISAGEGNRFGHPAPEVLERVAAVGATVLRTDARGTLQVVTDGEVMWWESAR